MALLLAPYNPAMQLGQGFNSYTQELCINSAVEVKHHNDVKAHKPPKEVSYNVSCIEKLSDVVEATGGSYSAAIKQGTLELHGQSMMPELETFKIADLNILLSVNVVTEIITMTNDGKLSSIGGITPGTEEFNQVFGDCYISGMIL